MEMLAKNKMRIISRSFTQSSCGQLHLESFFSLSLFITAQLRNRSWISSMSNQTRLCSTSLFLSLMDLTWYRYSHLIAGQWLSFSLKSLRSTFPLITLFSTGTSSTKGPSKDQDTTIEMQLTKLSGATRVERSQLSLTILSSTKITTFQHFCSPRISLQFWKKESGWQNY